MGWNLYQTFTRCGNPRCLKCAGDKTIRPHGPYFKIARHIPKGGHSAVQEVYLGSPRIHKWLTNVAALERFLTYMNRYWGIDTSPTRKQVLEIGTRIAQGKPVI